MDLHQTARPKGHSNSRHLTPSPAPCPTTCLASRSMALLLGAQVDQSGGLGKRASGSGTPGPNPLPRSGQEGNSA